MFFAYDKESMKQHIWIKIFHITPFQVTHSENFDKFYPIGDVKQFNLTSSSSILFVAQIKNDPPIAKTMFSLHHVPLLLQELKQKWCFF